MYREMQRYGRILMILAFAIGTFVIGMTPYADAAFVLTLDDPTTAGIDVIVSDDLGVGAFTTVGVTTDADGTAGAAGIITFLGTVGSFVVSVTTGFSKPLIGPPALLI